MSAIVAAKHSTDAAAFGRSIIPAFFSSNKTAFTTADFYSINATDAAAFSSAIEATIYTS